MKWLVRLLFTALVLHAAWTEYRLSDYDHVRVDAIRAYHLGPGK